MKLVMDRSKSGKKQNSNFTLKNRLISLYFDMKRICTKVKMFIYSLWIYTGSVLECSGRLARVPHRSGKTNSFLDCYPTQKKTFYLSVNGNKTLKQVSFKLSF